MGLPKYYEMYSYFLSAIQDEKIHSLKEVKNFISQALHLSAEELTELLPSGNQAIFDNRVGWTRTYLNKAGLISVPSRAHFLITPEGKSLLLSGETITDQLLIEKYPLFAAFKQKKLPKTSATAEISPSEPDTPQEVFEHVYQSINNQLSDDLLAEIMNQTPIFFEHLVVDLMRIMGYGDGFVTKKSGDGGIDGIIHEDKLGFNLIYIQAKRWDSDKVISRPEIQKFAGAMMGPPRIEKGLFISTAKFSQGAIDFANAQHIILMDGNKLAELMIEYGLGVSTQKVYKIKRIDTDYFSEI